MSTLTIQADQFVVNKLQPNLDELNMSLVSMEEYGFMNVAIKDTRRKLNKLTSIYTFLKEYAYGNEEVEESVIRDLMNIAGISNVSKKSLDPSIQSVRSSPDINESISNHSIIRVYLDDEILNSNTIITRDYTSTIKVHSSNNANKIEVAYATTGMIPIVYTGVTNVTIPYVELNFTDVVTLDVKTYNNDVLLLEKTLVYNVLYANCSELLFWLGSTIERFEISSDLDESSNITISPNDGTASSGITLDFDWIMNNPINMIETMFREDVTLRMSVNVDDTHAIILLPTNLEISDVKEVIVDLDDNVIDDNGASDMTLGTHYNIFNINSTTRKYNCVYFRDLTSTTFPSRTFQFNIKYIQ